MKKTLLFIFIGLTAACSDKVESPLELVKTTTIRDTYDFCMKTNGSRKYCNCEMDDLEKTFPWADYIKAIDALAGEEGHVAKVIEKYSGDRKKILAELNCETCYFTTALGSVNVKPSPRCAEELLK
jgi:hypothetical protein